jgi:hypothetical protein
MSFWDGFILGLMAGLWISVELSVMSFKRSIYNKGTGKDPTRLVIKDKLFRVVEDK